MLQKELLEAARERNIINWENISAAIKYYQKDFKYIEVPWTVSKEATKYTWKDEALECQAGDLIGSAEQGFIDLAINKLLPEEGESGFVSASPCFRIEPQYDQLHHITFFKVELYSCRDNAEGMMLKAKKMFDYTLGKRTRVVDQGTGNWVWQKDLILDINGNEIELGSYGYRNINGMKWSYGTGWAEPRMSLAFKMISKYGVL